MDILWSQAANGRVVLYLDGKKVVRATGPNMLNAYQHYFKVGSYRSDKIDGDGWVYVKNITTHKS